MSVPQVKPKRAPVGKKSKKGAAWKFTLDLTHPVEDGILDSANFVSSQLAVKLSTQPQYQALVSSVLAKG